MLGSRKSGVSVPTTTRSMSAASIPAWARARWQATTHMSEVASSGAAKCRSQIPVRCTIHSCEVSTIWAK